MPTWQDHGSAGSVQQMADDHHHPARSLAGILDRLAAGCYPPPDGDVTIVRQPSPRDCGVLSCTAHAVIFADTDPGWIRGQLPDGDLGAPIGTAFLHALCTRTGRQAGSIDMLCVAPPLAGPPAIGLTYVEMTATGSAAHPRLSRALRYRDDVRAWHADGGIALLGRGVAARWEVAIEVEPRSRGRGLGRQLATAARALVPDDAPLWAQVAPGNAASVRAFVAAGFVPVGAEVLLSTAEAGAWQ
jgi:GNAT superfamily N-acetyltransferase